MILHYTGNDLISSKVNNRIHHRDCNVTMMKQTEVQIQNDLQVYK